MVKENDRFDSIIYVYFSKNGGTCILLENNQGRHKFVLKRYYIGCFVAQCLCTPVFRGLACNQFSYIPCGDATCHGTQVKERKMMLLVWIS